MSSIGSPTPMERYISAKIAPIASITLVGLIISKEIDIVNDLKGKVITQTKKTKFYYCQDDNIYSILFENYINKRLKSDKQVPVILTLKANVHNKPKDIFIDIETIAPLNYNTIMKNMVLLYDYNLNF